jgi:hypothetical protein
VDVSSSFVGQAVGVSGRVVVGNVGREIGWCKAEDR